MPFPIVSRRRFLSASAASAVLPVAASASAAATPLAAGGTGDRTGDVQAAIDALGPRGGTVVVPEGARFNLQALRFTPRVNLEYRIDDDRSANMPFPKRATNERVYFAANSSWPEQDTGATANEWRFTAPFHPGLTVDVRKDLAGADAHHRALLRLLFGRVRDDDAADFLFAFLDALHEDAVVERS